MVLPGAIWQEISKVDKADVSPSTLSSVTLSEPQTFALKSLVVHACLRRLPAFVRECLWFVEDVFCKKKQTITVRQEDEVLSCLDLSESRGRVLPEPQRTSNTSARHKEISDSHGGGGGTPAYNCFRILNKFSCIFNDFVPSLLCFRNFPLGHFL